MNTKWIKEELNAYTNKSVNENDILIAYERIAYIFGLNSPSHIKLNNHFGIDLISKKYRLFSDTDTSLDEIYDDIEDMMILLNISELNKKIYTVKDYTVLLSNCRSTLEKKDDIHSYELLVNGWKKHLLRAKKNNNFFKRWFSFLPESLLKRIINM